MTMAHHMQTKVVDVISKRPSLRHNINIQMVLPWLRKKSELLKDMDKDVLTDVIRNCAYQKAVFDDVIIRQGEQGDSFYIMLTGSTSVYIDTTKSDDEPKNDNLENEENTRFRTQTGAESDEEECGAFEDDMAKKKRRKPINRKLFGKFMIHYEAGKSFGEVALLSEDSVRNATIIADEDTDLLVISRELFNRSVKTKQEEEYKERKNFIQNSPFFHNWSLKFRKLLEMSIRKEIYPAGSTIIKQGDPVAGLLFMLSGQAKVTVHPSTHGIQFPLLMKQEINPVAKEIGRNIYNKTEKHQVRTFTQQQIQIRRKEGYAAAEKRIMNKTVELCCIEANDVVGDIEMVLELDRSVSTIRCTENTTVMVLDTKNYDRLIAKKNQHTINKLCSTALQKVQSRALSGKGVQVPILSILRIKLREKLPIREQANDKPKVDKQKSYVMEQLIKLFIDDKVPLIEPFVPNSLYYRIKSDKRAKMIEVQEQKKRGQPRESRVEERLHDFKQRRKVARSLKQLRNMKAENELLRTDKTEMYSMLLRPRTAIGIRHERQSKTNGRPHTAGIFHLTECDVDPNTQKDDVSVDGDVGQIVQKIGTVQKGKNEIRSKIVCSATVVSEIKSVMHTGNSSSGSGSGANIGIADPFDDDYFDWETSNKKLCGLEDRIKQFCTDVDSKSSRDPPQVSVMRRFHIKDEKEDDSPFDIKVPKPGGTVFVRTRPCSHPGETTPSSDPNAHQHTRRFIVSRDEQFDYSMYFPRRPKSAGSTLTRRRNSSQRPKTASVRSISVLG